MTTTTASPSAHEPTGRRPIGLKRLWARLSPLYDLVLGEGLRTGRLIIRDLPAPQRLLAASALLGIAGLLCSILVSDRWRAGELLAVGAPPDVAFLPAALFPVTITAMWLGWLVILIGAIAAGARVQLLTTAIFLLVNVIIGDPVVESVAEAPALTIGIPLVRASYVVCAATLVVLALTSRVMMRRRRSLIVAAGAVAGIAATVMFGSLLWIQSTAIQLGQPNDLPTQLAFAALQLDNVLVLLVVMAQLSLVEFSHTLSGSIVSTVAPSALGLARTAFVVLLLTKVVLHVVDDRDQLMEYLTMRTGSVLRTVLSLALLFAAGLAASRLPRSGQSSAEPLLHGSALLYALPLLATQLLLVGALAVDRQLGTSVQNDVSGSLVPAVAEYGDLTMAGAVLLISAAVVAKRRMPLTRSALVVAVLIVSTWAALGHLLRVVLVDPGIHFPLVDLLVTVLVGAFAAARWRQLDGRQLAVLAALVVFTWLVLSEGDVFGLFARWLAVPALAMVVVGVVLTLLTGSGFTRRDSPLAPRGARTLLWLGYLVFNLSVLHWVQVTRTLDLGAAAGHRSFYYVGLPFAAWLVASRGFRLERQGR